jgi:hypothetical protein
VAFRCDQAFAERLQAIEPFVTSCTTNDEIPAEDRATLGREAMQFVETLLGSNPGLAYSTLTRDAKQNVSAEKFTSVVQQRILPNGPFKGLHVAAIMVGQNTDLAHAVLIPLAFRSPCDLSPRISILVSNHS